MKKKYDAYKVPKFVGRLKKERERMKPIRLCMDDSAKFERLKSGEDCEVTVPMQDGIMALLPDNLFFVGETEALILDGPKRLVVTYAEGTLLEENAERTIMITKILREGMRYGAEVCVQFILDPIEKEKQ